MLQGKATVSVVDNTGGFFTADQLWNLRWAVNYWGKYQYNWSPWVMYGYNVFAFERAIGAQGVNTWLLELLNDSSEAGALGWHEDPNKGDHSVRGLQSHNKLPLMKIFCKTSKEAGIQPSEVVIHELAEALVDPWVVNGEERKYLNVEKKEWYIAEVGDPVQGRGYDLGAPYGRSTGIVVADFAYPRWWLQPQGRPATSIASDERIWTGAVPKLGVAPFELAPEGYMSVAPENEPENWSQIYGLRKSGYFS